MKVFSNTTPIIALSSIGQLALLPALFKNVHLAASVIEECAAGGQITEPDLRGLPWVVPIAADSSDPPVSSLLFELDRGERDTLHLAMVRGADLVLLDERLGRNLADYLGLRVTGILGVLLKAKQQGLISSFADCAEAMRRQGIHFNSALIGRLAAEIGE